MQLLTWYPRDGEVIQPFQVLPPHREVIPCFQVLPSQSATYTFKALSPTTMKYSDGSTRTGLEWREFEVELPPPSCDGPDKVASLSFTQLASGTSGETCFDMECSEGMVTVRRNASGQPQALSVGADAFPAALVQPGAYPLEATTWSLFERLEPKETISGRTMVGPILIDRTGAEDWMTTTGVHGEGLVKYSSIPARSASRSASPMARWRQLCGVDEMTSESRAE
ncbi:uncharacterized protein MKK02DRAFT_40357 [Dioszegia hungarica]|uniref:Uncharacterized protein n=1 Tax=Dioszegia hungarica TaxID=4972 RepID=A0AA38H2W9_9TREE|nr:uncharacterized protein MKK02DRAFT_40357 [Dioszegia hungarica]KAI9632977.1 hypothetical protein MKK02DRAFT_40357 [Dioszegia hungarica]